MTAFFLETTSFIILLMIASGVTYLARRTRVPSTVLLVAVGVLVALLAKIPVFSILDDFELTSDILFYVFLPILLFESAYNLNYKSLLKNIRSVSLLAVTSLIFSAVLTGILFYIVLGWLGFHIPFLVTLLFGALISATDTAAALSIFKEVGVPKRLGLIFEGESLFNDGTAIALFMVVLGIVESHATTAVEVHHNLYATVFTHFETILGPVFPYINGMITMFSMIVMGIVIGLMVGIFFSKIIQRIQNDSYLEITLSLVLAHATFLLAEAINHVFLPVSGVIATVVAAMILGNYGRTKISPRVEEVMEKYWGLFTFVSNSLIFILVGMLIVNLDVDWRPLSGVIIAAFIITLITRALSVYPLIGVLNRTKKEEYIPRKWQHILALGALRGSVAIMLLYLIPQDLIIEGWPFIDHPIRDFLTSITVGVVVCSVFINTLIIAPLIRSLRIAELGDIEKVEFMESQIIILTSTLAKLTHMIQERYIDPDEGKLLLASYQSRLDVSKEQLIQFKNQYPENFGILVHRATARYALTTERHALLVLYKQNQLPEKVFKRLMNRLSAQLYRIDRGESLIDGIRDIRPKKDIFERFSEYVLDHLERKIDPIHARYYEVRTLHIIIEKALESLQSLSTVTAFAEQKEFHDVVELYEGFEREAEKVRRELFRTHREELRSLSGALAQQALIAHRDELLIRMEEDKILSSKLITELRSL